MNLFDLINQKKKISGEIIQLGLSAYGDLFLRSLEFIKKGGPKVMEYTFIPSKTKIWLVQGSKRAYLIYPGIFCQCKDYQINSIYRDQKKKLCKHLLAQKLAVALDKYEKEIYEDEKWEKISEKFIKN